MTSTVAANPVRRILYKFMEYYLKVSSTVLQQAVKCLTISRKVSPFGKTRQHVVVNETQKSMRTCVFMQKKVIVPVVRSMFVAAERVLWLCKFVIVRVIR